MYSEQMTTSDTSLVALTFLFRLLLFLLLPAPELRRGVVHETLNHVGPDQSESTEGSMFHHKQCQRRVEVGLLRQLLIGPDMQTVFCFFSWSLIKFKKTVFLQTRCGDHGSH